MSKSKPAQPGAAESPASRAKRLQMADIARLSGVSVSTVSRALAGSPLVNPETRARVEELARSLNYAINVGAQNLRRGHNRTVGVILPFDAQTRQHVSDPFFLSLMGSIADALTEQGFEMLLTRVDAERLDLAAQVYDTGRALGILLIGQWHHHDQLNMLAMRGVPMVVWGAHLAGQLYCTIGSDNRAGGRLATEHLIAQGCRRILFLGDPGLPEVALRREGHLQALAVAGIASGDGLLVPAPFAVELARAGLVARVARGIDFDGVFACSDLLAISVIGVLREHGVAVPEGLPVVGFDDIEIGRHFHPALSTVRQAIDSAGQAMVSALMRIVGGEKVAPVQLPTALVVRQTSRGG